MATPRNERIDKMQLSDFLEMNLIECKYKANQRYIQLKQTHPNSGGFSRTLHLSPTQFSSAVWSYCPVEVLSPKLKRNICLEDGSMEFYQDGNLCLSIDREEWARLVMNYSLIMSSLYAPMADEDNTNANAIPINAVGEISDNVPQQAPPPHLTPENVIDENDKAPLDFLDDVSSESEDGEDHVNARKSSVAECIKTYEEPKQATFKNADNSTVECVKISKEAPLSASKSLPTKKYNKKSTLPPASTKDGKSSGRDDSPQKKRSPSYENVNENGGRYEKNNSRQRKSKKPLKIDMPKTLSQDTIMSPQPIENENIKQNEFFKKKAATSKTNTAKNANRRTAEQLEKDELKKTDDMRYYEFVEKMSNGEIKLSPPSSLNVGNETSDEELNEPNFVPIKKRRRALKKMVKRAKSPIIDEDCESEDETDTKKSRKRVMRISNYTDSSESN